MSAEKYACDVDTNFAVARLLYNAVLDENIYSLFALFDLQANQNETDNLSGNQQLSIKSDAEKLRHRLIFNYQLLQSKKKW